MSAITSAGELSPVETARRENYETVIESGLGSVAKVAHAIRQIKLEGLWRPHESFDAYISARWTFGMRQANRLIALAKLNEGLETQGSPPVPSERIARELSRLPEDDRAEVWAEALKIKDGKPTADFVRTLVDTRLDVVDAVSTPVGETRLSVPEDSAVQSDRTSFDDSPREEKATWTPPERNSVQEADRIADSTRRTMTRDFRMLPISSRARWLELIKALVHELDIEVNLAIADITDVDREQALSMLGEELKSLCLGSPEHKLTWIAMLKKSLLDPHCRVPAPYRAVAHDFEATATAEGLAVAARDRRGVIVWDDIHEAFADSPEEAT